MAKITLVSSRCHEIFLPVVMALVFLSFGPSVVLRADPPDPRVLLKGVEDSRISIPSGRIDLIVETTNLRQPKSGVRRKQLKIAFDGPKRRFDQYEKVLFVDGTKPGASDPSEKLRAMGGDTEAFVRAGLGTLKDVHIRSAYDGTQFMQYSEDMGAYVRDASKGSPDYAFDPRVMGITVWFTLDDDVPGDLGYRDAKSIRSMGETILDGHTVWHVLVVDKSDRERHFWIDAQDFRVYKMTLQSQFQHLSSISEFKEQRVVSVSG